MESPLDPKIPSNARDNTENKSVISAIQVIQQCWDEKNRRDNKNLMIQKLLEHGFEVADPSGTRKIDGYVLQQAFWRTANRMKPLDFQLHATGRPEAQEKIVTAAVGQVMSEGGYLSSLRDKGGAFNYSLLFGDAFLSVGASDNKDIPIEFCPLANTNVYIDNYATVMRGGGPGRSVSKMVIVQSMSWANLLEFYPEAKGKAGVGAIPRDLNFFKETGRTFLQTEELQYDYVEVAHSYDIVNKVYCVFVGAACTVIKELKGDKYPFIKDKKPYIPVIHYMCWPAVEGFWNHGLGDMLYKLCIMTRRFMNMAIGHAEDNVYPITLVNVPNQEVSKFFNKLTAAHEMRNEGKKGYVAMEYDPTNPSSSRVQAEQLQTPAALSEWEAVYNRLDLEIQRLGINLNDIEPGAQVTATQIMMEEESSNALVKQIREYNASEEKFAVELTLDFMKKFIRKSNDTLVHLPSRMKTENEEGQMVEIEMNQITLGAVADELRKNDYFCIINARTGSIPSNIVQQAQLSRLMPFAQPGTKAFGKIAEKMAQLNNSDLGIDDFAPEAPEPMTTEEGEAAITETDRPVIDGKMKPEPAF